MLLSRKFIEIKTIQTKFVQPCYSTNTRAAFEREHVQKDYDDGWPMVRDLLMVVSQYRETTVPKLIVNCFTEIQNWSRC